MNPNTTKVAATILLTILLTTIIAATLLPPIISHIPTEPFPQNPTNESETPTQPTTPTDPQPPIRPGSPVAGNCTLGFLLTNGSTLYALTAAHCTTNHPQGSTIPIHDQYNSTLQWANDTTRIDAALLQLSPTATQAARPHPTGITGNHHTAPKPDPGTILYTTGQGHHRNTHNQNHSQGPFTGEAPPGYAVQFIPPGLPGDSGAPVTTPNGGAVGILHAHGIGWNLTPTNPALCAACNWITPLTRIQSALHDAGYNLTLWTGQPLH